MKLLATWSTALGALAVAPLLMAPPSGPCRPACHNVEYAATLQLELDDETSWTEFDAAGGRKNVVSVDAVEGTVSVEALYFGAAGAKPVVVPCRTSNGLTSCTITPAKYGSIGLAVTPLGGHAQVEVEFAVAASASAEL
jgi:hypothetical protein